MLPNKCINENIVVLNNEIMSFKMGSKGPLSLKNKSSKCRLRAFHRYIAYMGMKHFFFVIFDVGASKEALKEP